MYLTLNFLVPFALSILRRYQESPSLTYDDLILQGVKDGVAYLVNKDNNDVNAIQSVSLNSSSMEGGF